MKEPIARMPFNRAVVFALLTAGGIWAGTRSSTPLDSKAPLRTELRLVDCHDGDTCTARTREGIRLTLRLLGVDAPEVAGKKRGRQRQPGQAFGEQARAYINQRVQGRRLPVELRGHDVYHRYLAIIWDETHQHRINEDLVAEGYAFAYRDRRVAPDVRAWAESAEAGARRARVGLWGLPPAERPANPAEFRRLTR